MCMQTVTSDILKVPLRPLGKISEICIVRWKGIEMTNKLICKWCDCWKIQVDVPVRMKWEWKLARYGNSRHRRGHLVVSIYVSYIFTHTLNILIYNMHKIFHCMLVTVNNHLFYCSLLKIISYPGQGALQQTACKYSARTAPLSILYADTI